MATDYHAHIYTPNTLALIVAVRYSWTDTLTPFPHHSFRADSQFGKPPRASPLPRMATAVSLPR